MFAFTDGLLAGYGIAIPLGAIGILIVGMGVRSGFRIGFMAGAGAATADLLYAVVASTAGAVVTTLLAPIAPILRIWRAPRYSAVSQLALKNGSKFVPVHTIWPRSDA